MEYLKNVDIQYQLINDLTLKLELYEGSDAVSGWSCVLSLGPVAWIPGSRKYGSDHIKSI